MNGVLVYEERVSSPRTQALFAGLTILFSMLLRWRRETGRQGVGTVAFFLLSIFFLFCTLNYRVLVIRLTPECLKLKFGIFSWTIPLDNVGACRLDDDLSAVMKYGGAGIHFMMVRGRYRASFNFLEHPRVVVALNRKAGPVQDISFSTRHPAELIRLLQRD